MRQNSFIDAILTFFGVRRDPDSEKKRQIRVFAREIAKNQFSRFFKVQGEEIEPAFAQYFYEIYRLTAPVHATLENIAKSAKLKRDTIQYFLEPPVQELVEELRHESIEAKALTVGAEALVSEVEERLERFGSMMDAGLVRKIDETYSLILNINDFVSFDFFFLLRKFDPKIPEGNFAYRPRFEAVRGEALCGLIKDFMEAAGHLRKRGDWQTAFDVLKRHKDGFEVITLPQWEKITGFVRDLEQSEILTLIVRVLDKDPLFQAPEGTPQEEHIAAPFIQDVNAEASGVIKELIRRQKNAQVEAIAKTVFGTDEMNQLLNYNEENSNTYKAWNLPGFTCVQGLTYLKTFLTEYFRHDIRETCDLFLVRGQWVSQSLSQELSEGCHGLSDIMDQLQAFDEGLGKTGERGGRLFSALSRAERDRGVIKHIRAMLIPVNDEAQKMIKSAAQDLIKVGKNFKGLLEDRQKSPNLLIINWKELENSSQVPLIQSLTLNYKKIYYFVQMLQIFAKPDE